MTQPIPNHKWIKMKSYITFFILLSILLFSCNQNSNGKIPESKMYVEEPKSYTFGLFYRDVENNFRIQYPSNWELVAGEAKHTVVKFVNRDSSMALSISVIKNDGSIPIEKLTETQLFKYKMQLTSALSSINKQPIDMKVENGFLDNQNAIIISYQYVQKQINIELLFQQFQVQAANKGMIYTVSLSSPKKYYSEAYSSYMNNFLYSFRFDSE